MNPKDLPSVIKPLLADGDHVSIGRGRARFRSSVATLKALVPDLRFDPVSVRADDLFDLFSREWEAVDLDLKGGLVRGWTPGDSLARIGIVGSNADERFPELSSGSRPTPGLLDFVSRASSKDSSRPGLCGVRFRPGAIVATDGTRVHMLATGNQLTETEATIPVLAASWIAKQAATFEIAPSGDFIDAGTGEVSARFRAIEDGFPPAENVIPKRGSGVSWEIPAGEVRDLCGFLDRFSEGHALRISEGSISSVDEKAAGASVSSPVPEGVSVLVSSKLLLDASRMGSDNWSRPISFEFFGNGEPLVLRQSTQAGEALAAISPLAE